MNEKRKRLPIGIDSFSKIRKENFYYVDKTGFIKDLLNDWGEVNLFTRPRRFGKSLNMSMLKAFFEFGAEASLFDGLIIGREKELCQTYLGKYPVLTLSFKDVNGRDYKEAYQILCSVVSDEAQRLCRQYGLLESRKLLDSEKQLLEDIVCSKFEAGVTGSIKLLCRVLSVHCEKEVIFLLDEYDVPLDKAHQNGYYEEMLTMLRNMLSMALKSNSDLHFAVLTGCLRIARESIFTGLNNFVVNSVSDVEYAEHFGFTDEEVRKMLAYYDAEDAYDDIREWYDGYHFGQENIYCPWDVVNYLRKRLSNNLAQPESYWVNSSGNSIIRNILNGATQTTKAQLEALISGEVIEKKITPELTYKDLNDKNVNVREAYLWSVMYATGYLTEIEKTAGGLSRLKIPNREIREIYDEKILEWFATGVQSNTAQWKNFCTAIKTGDITAIQNIFNDIMAASISIRDTFSRKERKENFYHGMLLGILQCEGEWDVSSNLESGIGYSDILVELPKEKIGCVIEVKYAENGEYEKECDKALKQIETNGYTERLKRDGMENIFFYAIACYKKNCVVQGGKEVN